MPKSPSRKASGPVSRGLPGVPDVNPTFLHYAAPWLTCTAAYPVAALTHALWHGDPVMETLLGGGAAAFTYSVHTLWARRHEHTRLLATVFAGAVSGWTVLAAATSLTSHSMFNAWALGGLLLSGVWNAKSIAHAPKHDSDRASGGADGLLEEAGGALKGASVTSVRSRPGRVVAEIQLQPGQTADGAQGQRGQVASLLGVGKDEVKVLAKKRADQIRMIIQRSEDLQKTVRWPGASHPGASVADFPLSIGERADGSEIELWVCGDNDVEHPRPLAHLLTTGITGSGKTNTIIDLLVELLSRRDAVAVVADPEKFAQGFGSIAEHLAVAAVNEEQARQLIRNLPDAIRYRSAVLAELGYDQWEKECWDVHRIPLVFVDVEEATTVLQDDGGDFDQALRTARSCGIMLCASLNTATHSNIDRKSRGQFAQTFCHGCKEMFDARFSLSETTLEAGANPTAWGNDFPGSVYAELTGTPRENWSSEGRAYGMSRAQARAELAQSRPGRAELDPGTMLHLGRGIVFPDEKIHAALAGPAGLDDQDTVVLIKVATEEGEIDVSQPIPAPKYNVPFSLAPKQVKMSTEDARQLIEARVDRMEAEGETEVSAAALADLAPTTGRSPAWVYGELHRLVESGRLADSPTGKPPYFIRPRVSNGHRQ